VYMPAGGNGTADMYKLFEKKYGIETDVVRANSPPALRERIRTEQTAGHFIADIVSSGSTIRNIIEMGQVAKHPPLPNVSKLKPPSEDDGYFVDFGVIPHALLINIDTVKPADRPKSWLDLLDPK